MGPEPKADPEALNQKQKDQKEPSNIPYLKKIPSGVTAETPMEKLMRLENAKPISSDEEESEFSPVESQRPSYEFPERRQKSKLLYYEPSEQEGKTKNKPLLKEETPDWEKHKQRDEKSPDPKQNIQIGKGRGTDKIPEKDLNLIKKQGELFPEDDKPMQLKPFDSAKPSTKDETKYMPYSTEKKGSEIEKRTPKNTERQHEKPDSAKPTSSDEEESEFSPVESQRPSYELPERRQKSKLLFYEASEQEGKTKNKPSLKEETPDWEKLKQKDEKSPVPKQNIQIGKERGSAKPISSDEEESEFSPVESQHPSYELPERRQKSKLLYYEPSEQEEKIKNKPLLKEETPDWEKHKQRDEKSPDPKQ